MVAVEEARESFDPTKPKQPVQHYEEPLSQKQGTKSVVNTLKV